MEENLDYNIEGARRKLVVNDCLIVILSDNSEKE